MTTTLLDASRIAPPRGAIAAEQSMPLTFNDIIFLTLHPIHRILFYELPYSKPHFLETVVPKLKQSLSLTLKHLFPLAGNIVYPLNSDELPVIRYIPGDSVPLMIRESSDDFDTFVAYHARDADKFYDLIPQFPPVIEESGHKLLKVLALQVTFFPGRGVSIGAAFHHSAVDGASVAAFVRLWASVNKFGGDEEFLNSKSHEPLPIFDRAVFKYPTKLDSFYWKIMRNAPSSLPSFPIPTGRVRATFVLSKSELEKLKRLIRSAVPDIGHLSSFVAMAAYIWSCFAKSGGEEEDDHPEILMFMFDIRDRLDPPLPKNYFGNCLSYGFARVGHRELVREYQGLFTAAEAVAKEIREKGSDKKKILEDAEKWLGDIISAKKQSILVVTGSARVDLYGADFGWGKARKLEVLSIDEEKFGITLGKSRDFEGGLEITISLPKVRMESFASAFAHGLKNLSM